jgi:hypothetical protein
MEHVLIPILFGVREVERGEREREEPLLEFQVETTLTRRGSRRGNGRVVDSQAGQRDPRRRGALLDQRGVDDGESVRATEVEQSVLVLVRRVGEEAVSGQTRGLSEGPELLGGPIEAGETVVGGDPQEAPPVFQDGLDVVVRQAVSRGVHTEGLRARVETIQASALRSDPHVALRVGE